MKLQVTGWYKSSLKVLIVYNYYILCICTGLVEDVYVVPVSISYEKLLDGNFNNEQMVGHILPGDSCITGR